MANDITNSLHSQTITYCKIVESLVIVKYSKCIRIKIEAISILNFVVKVCYQFIPNSLQLKFSITYLKHRAEYNSNFKFIEGKHTFINFAKVKLLVTVKVH